MVLCKLFLRNRSKKAVLQPGAEKLRRSQEDAPYA